MERLIVEGGHQLNGRVSVSGAKNAALPLLLATLLADGEHRLENVPRLSDIDTSCRVLESIGAGVTMEQESVLIDTGSINNFEATYELVKTMRASVLVLGPLLARFGRARVSLPGGCAIGARPVDQHLKGLAALGADFDLVHGYIEARAKKLVGGKIIFDMPTVGATEQVLMAAVLARGESVIENAACEPEIVDLARALTSMGGIVEGAGSPVIRVQGVPELAPMRHRVMPDRIEAGTLLIAGAITGGEVELLGASAEDMGATLSALESMGVRTMTNESGNLCVMASGRPVGTTLTTAPHPGFATDMQAQFMALASIAHGPTLIKETIFENRFMHVPELGRMGAQIQVSGNCAVVTGREKLSSADVMATDLRASASLVLAALAAQGTSSISRIYHLDRGYDRLELKLTSLGAQIRREAKKASQ